MKKEIFGFFFIFDICGFLQFLRVCRVTIIRNLVKYLVWESSGERDKSKNIFVPFSVSVL